MAVKLGLTVDACESPFSAPTVDVGVGGTTFTAGVWLSADDPKLGGGTLNAAGRDGGWLSNEGIPL